MKKILTLMVSALFAGGAFAQAPSNNAVGLYRTVLDKDYLIRKRGDEKYFQFFIHFPQILSQ